MPTPIAYPSGCYQIVMGFLGGWDVFEPFVYPDTWAMSASIAQLNPKFPPRLPRGGPHPLLRGKTC